MCDHAKEPTMDPQTSVHNPFMLLVNPEAVIAAMEKSERLGRLNRHMCRPLDRVLPGTAPEALDPEESQESADPDAANAGDASVFTGGITGDVTPS
jgi:hypothetical protein